jgi:hypothetical protein
MQLSKALEWLRLNRSALSAQRSTLNTFYLAVAKKPSIALVKHIENGARKAFILGSMTLARTRAQHVRLRLRRAPPAGASVSWSADIDHSTIANFQRVLMSEQWQILREHMHMLFARGS